MKESYAEKFFNLQRKLQLSSEDDYVHVDIVLSDHCWKDKATGIKLNVYTPKLGHNNFFKWEDAFEFIEMILEKGENFFVPQRLKEKISKLEKDISEGVDHLAELKKELESYNEN